MGSAGQPAGFLPIAFGDTAGWTVVGAEDLNYDGVSEIMLQHPSLGVGAWELAPNGQITGFMKLQIPPTFLNGWRVNGK